MATLMALLLASKDRPAAPACCLDKIRQTGGVRNLVVQHASTEVVHFAF